MSGDMKKTSDEEPKKNINFDERKFLTLLEVQEIYGIAADTLRKWIKRDGSDGIPKLDAFKPGKEILINKKTLELYIMKFPISA